MKKASLFGFHRQRFSVKKSLADVMVRTSFVDAVLILYC